MAHAYPVPESALLRVEALEVWRGDNCLFAGLDLELRSGQLALLVGHNGAGKTTLLRTLSGLTPPTSGRVFWRGTEVRRLAPEQRAEIAYRGHMDGLKRELTVEENLDFCRTLYGGHADTTSLLDRVALLSRRRVQVRHLSAGQRRRTGLATLRLAGARLWILDEPMTHLDEAGRSLVSAWIREHIAQQGMAIVATHRPDELADRGALMIEL